MSATPTPAPPDATEFPDGAIEFYWRPGCPFCMNLERELEGSEIPLDKRNIWESEEAAAFVRSVADGNEVVPTVRVGATSMVNPSPAEVATVMANELPELAGRMAQQQQPGPIGKLLQRLLGA